MAQQDRDATVFEQRTENTLNWLVLMADHQMVRLNGRDRVWSHEETFSAGESNRENSKIAVFKPRDINYYDRDYERGEDRRLRIAFHAPIGNPEDKLRPTYRISRCDDWTEVDAGEVQSLRPPNARGIGWSGRETWLDGESGRKVQFSGPSGEHETLPAAEQLVEEASLVERVVTDESRYPDTEIVDYYRKTIISFQYGHCFWTETKLIVPEGSWAVWVSDNAQAGDDLSDGPMRPEHGEAIAATLADPTDMTWTRTGPEEMPDDVDHWRTREPTESKHEFREHAPA